MRVLGSSSAVANHLTILAGRVVRCGQLHEVQAQPQLRNRGTRHGEHPRLTQPSCSSLYSITDRRPRQRRQRRCTHPLLMCGSRPWRRAQGQSRPFLPLTW